MNVIVPALTPASDVVLRASGLSIDAPGPHGVTRLVDNVSFEVRRHEVFGIVGESSGSQEPGVGAGDDMPGLQPPTLRRAWAALRCRRPGNSGDVAELRPECARSAARGTPIIFQTR